MADSDNRYNPGPDFQEDNRSPVLPISLSDSTELWLIQWPINQLQLADFHGKEISLKLHRDGKLASFENASGKSYELVSFAAQEPDATVFLPSSSGSKVVGKISRRVCLLRYPEPGDFEKRSASTPNLSNLGIQGSKKRALHHLSSMYNSSSIYNNGSASAAAKSSKTISFSPSLGQVTLKTPVQQPRIKEHRDQTPADPTRFTGQTSLGSQPESQVTATTSESMKSHAEKFKKKKYKAQG